MITTSGTTCNINPEPEPEAEGYTIDIYSATAGTVYEVGSEQGFGLCVKVSGKKGFPAIYGHLSEICVEQGQYVKRGDVVGRVVVPAPTTQGWQCPKCGVVYAPTVERCSTYHLPDQWQPNGQGWVWGEPYRVGDYPPYGQTWIKTTYGLTGTNSQ